jgi:hypothetical protein
MKKVYEKSIPGAFFNNFPLPAVIELLMLVYNIPLAKEEGVDGAGTRPDGRQAREHRRNPRCRKHARLPRPSNPSTIFV